MPESKPVRVEKPWVPESFGRHPGASVAKFLHIKAGHALSLQYHLEKDETVYMLSGRMRFQTGAEGEELRDRVLGPGEAFHITPLLRHRMIAETDCDVLEASTPELQDVVRLEDRYGRTKECARWCWAARVSSAAISSTGCSIAATRWC